MDLAFGPVCPMIIHGNLNKDGMSSTKTGTAKLTSQNP
jgi:hypothetical protein